MENYIKKKSKKSYTIAVILSSISGVIGLQHFYLGRYMEGLIDVFLTVAWIYFLFIERHIFYFIILLCVDLLHSFVVTILLLIGSYKDGEGAYVCYPGQQLK